MSNADNKNNKKFGIDKLDRFCQIEQTYNRKKFIEINPKLIDSFSILKVEFTKFSTVILTCKLKT